MGRLNQPRVYALMGFVILFSVSCSFSTRFSEPPPTESADASLVIPATSGARTSPLPASKPQPMPKPDLLDYPFSAAGDVNRWIRFYTVRYRGSMQIFLDRYAYYRPMIEEILAEYDLPTELIYMAMVESGFRNHAISPAEAGGMWQFMPATGAHFGLKMNRLVDDRRDSIRATRAAATYLTDLYQMFQSWHLAMAAYNAGEARIMRAIMKTSSKSYWDLVKKRVIPHETRQYVPKFIALATIGSNPEKYGFTLPQGKTYRPDLVTIKAPQTLRTLAKVTQTPLSKLKKYNPHLRTTTIPFTRHGTYDLWLPKEASESYQRHLARTTRSSDLVLKDHTMRIHKVQTGETLSAIAKRYGMSVKHLMSQNSLSSTLIHKGEDLLIIPPEGSSKAKHYVVRPGDNLQAIARRFGVSVQWLKDLNDFEGNLIYAGQRILVTPNRS